MEKLSTEDLMNTFYKHFLQSQLLEKQKSSANYFNSKRSTSLVFSMWAIYLLMLI